jgi:HlyD family secretion protein
LVETIAKPRKHRRIWLPLALAALVVASIVTAWRLSSSAPAAHYTTAPVTRGDVTRTVTATGTVNPVLTIIVGSYVSGAIQDVNCDYNTQVKKGQVCAKIDPRPYQSAVDQAVANLGVAKAQLEKDKATLEYARITYDRNVRLEKTDAVSKDAVDNAKSAMDQAIAQTGVDDATIKQRQAALDAAQVNLDYTDIISPVEGTVVSRNITIGQTVAASFQTPTLFLIATDLTQMQVDTNVSESDIGGIKDGDKALFTVDAFPTRTFKGTVSQVRQSPQTVQNVVTYDVVVSVDNTDLVLKPGMTAATRVIVDQRHDVLRVPSQALRYVPSGTTARSDISHLFVLRDGSPIEAPVTVGLDDDSFTEILSGDLKEGDSIIVSERQSGGRAAVPAPRF